MSVGSRGILWLILLFLADEQMCGSSYTFVFNGLVTIAGGIINKQSECRYVRGTLESERMEGNES